MKDRTNTLVIRTPEGITFSLLLAGPVTRFLAWAVDVGCVIVLAMAAGMGLGLLAAVSADLARALGLLAYFVIQIGYRITAEWLWRGQTLGKWLLRLRVMDAHGLKLRFSQIVIRNLLRFIDMLPAFYVVGGAATLLTRRSQRLGDIAANTVVVRNPAIEQPDLSQISGGKYNSFRAYPHLEARLRQRISPVEARLAIDALVRRDELEDSARIELFAEIARHFRNVVEFPPEAIEGLTDEQYVRNVAETLFRRPAGRQRLENQNGKSPLRMANAEDRSTADDSR
jgi:uncharacterized RDD family membrane protein YckC